jgi:hypothetical protein
VSAAVGAKSGAPADDGATVLSVSDNGSRERLTHADKVVRAFSQLPRHLPRAGPHRDPHRPRRLCRARRAVGYRSGNVEGEIRGPTRCVCKPVRVTYGPEPTPNTARAATDASAPATRSFASEDFLARRRSKARLIDLYVFRIDREVIDMAAKMTRRFGKVLAATSVHASRVTEGPWSAAHLATAGPPARPTSAALQAGFPFSGVGRYRTRREAAPTWLGSLAVRVPGEGKINLAGREFRAVICGYEKARTQRRCEREVAPPHVV